MKLYVDTRQRAGKHERKHSWLEGHGCELVSRKLDVGDYMLEGVEDISVDTKKDIDEIAMNIGGRNHARFRNECKRAKDAGVRLVVLVENIYEVEKPEDLRRWTNTHCKTCARRYNGGCNPHKPGKCPRHSTRKPIQGSQLCKAMRTMEQRYGVEFQFCHPRDCGMRILQILKGGASDDSGE